MTADVLTRNQLGALDAVDQHGHLDAGWGGYSFATLRSLERRGLLSTSIADERRFSLTQRGHDAIRARDMAEHPEWFAEVES